MIDEDMKWVRVPSAPSIPVLYQSFGYEEGSNGQLVLQKPLHVGHSGRSGDTVGPGEYTPELRYSSNFRNRATDFARSKVISIDILMCVERKTSSKN